MQGFILVGGHQISPSLCFMFSFFTLHLPRALPPSVSLVQLCPTTKCMESIKCLEVCSVYVLIEIAPDCVCLSDSPVIWYQPPVVRCGGSVIPAAQ